MRVKVLVILLTLNLLNLQAVCFAQEDKASPQGIIKEYYLNGSLKSEISYQGDKLEGASKEYYESGALASERYYKDGKRDGVCRVYSEDGKLQMETVYKAGQFIDSREFDEQGNPKQGTIKEYYPGGNLWIESSYQDGRLEGPSKVYYENGAVSKESNYKNGKLISEKEFDQTGKLISQENYTE